MNSVAILFDNFGPYHLARLRAAAGMCHLLAVEVAGTSVEYTWERNDSEEAFRRITLISTGTSRDVKPGELRARLYRALDEFKPDVVVIPGWVGSAALGAMQWSIEHRVPMVCMSESTEWDEARVAWKEWVKRRLVGLFSAALVGGGPHRDYLGKLGLDAARIFCGYDAVDKDYFSVNADAARGRRAEGAANPALPASYFLASARFIEKKNLRRLLEAYAMYRSSRPVATAWSLVLLGDGALRGALEDQLANLALGKHVLMPGFKQYPELPTYYGLARAFIHASTIEPWGLVVNEAMACGLPVLVSNCCGCASDLVRDGVNGYTFDPTDAAAMARLMSQITDMGPRLADFGRASRQIVARWGPERFAVGLGEAVSVAMKNPPPRPSLMDRALVGLVMRR